MVKHQVNISTRGQKHLGAVLGSRSYLEEYVSEKVDDWVGHVVKLAEFAVTSLLCGIYLRFEEQMDAIFKNIV